MNEKDVLGALRMEGVRDMREVQYAIVEHDGTVSVLPYDWAQPAIKADVDTETSKERLRALGGVDAPPLEKRTDSSKALNLSSEDVR